MVEFHGLGYSVQCLNEDICLGNGSVDITTVISHKNSLNEDLSLSSSKGSNKKQKTSEIGVLSSSIEKHGESLIKVAKIAAMQQDKDQSQAQETSILTRID